MHSDSVALVVEETQVTKGTGHPPRRCPHSAVQADDLSTMSCL